MPAVLAAISLFLCAICAIGCGGGGGLGASSAKPTSSTTLTVSSSAVANGGVLPTTYCAFGGNQSLPLAVTGVPATAAALAVVLDDPDAPDGTWAHWLLVDLPSTTTSLAAGADASGLPAGTRRGATSGGSTGYEGPDPPAGSTHRYQLRIYALSTKPLSIDLARTWTRAQFEAAYAASILASGGMSFTVTGPAS